MSICSKCLKDVSKPFHGLHHDCFISWFNVSAIDDFQGVFQLDDTYQSSQQFQNNTSFFQGKFKKYGARLGTENYILKVKDEDYPELPGVEYCSNQLALQLKIRVPPFYYIEFLNKLNTFVVRNFMTQGKPSNLVHIYHFLNNDDYSIKECIDTLLIKIGRIDAIQQFVWICLFDALIGNHDRHGRNIGLIQDKNGFKLSPFYDNPSYIGIVEQDMLEADWNPTGRIMTSHTTEPTIKDYALEFINLGYKIHVAEFFNNMQKVNFSETIDQSHISPERKEAFKRLVHKNRKEFIDVLQTQ